MQPAHEEVRQEIKAAACLTPDETGWRVAGQSAWLHAWVAPRATCYAIDRHRKADVLERLIGIAWSGTMVHDGFASYDRFAAATHQQCLGHILRRVRDLEAKATRGAVHYPRKLIALFTEAIHLRNRYLGPRGVACGPPSAAPPSAATRRGGAPAHAPDGPPPSGPAATPPGPSRRR